MLKQEVYNSESHSIRGSVDPSKFASNRFIFINLLSLTSVGGSVMFD